MLACSLVALFLEVISESVCIGKGVTGKPVYQVGACFARFTLQVKKVDFVKVPNPYNEYANVKYISMLEEVLSIANLYYSHHEDLTKRLQGAHHALALT